MEQKSDISLQM